MAENKKYFVPDGQVPEGKDGNLVWCEEHPKGGSVWYSKPVSRAELPPDVKEKKSCFGKEVS